MFTREQVDRLRLLLRRYALASSPGAGIDRLIAILLAPDPTSVLRSLVAEEQTRVKATKTVLPATRDAQDRTLEADEKLLAELAKATDPSPALAVATEKSIV